MPETPTQLQLILSSMKVLTDEFQSMKTNIKDIEKDVKATKEIVEAWEAVKVGGRFVKWLAGIGTGVAGLWVVAKAIGVSLFR